MKTTRESNYDLLRIISAFAVVMIHVTGTYENALEPGMLYNKLDVSRLDWIYLCVALPKFAVPCFVMLSGAFVLSDEKNCDYNFFYKKTLSKIGIHTIIFSFLYVLYVLLQTMIEVAFNGAKPMVLVEPIVDWIKGSPYYHMWYMYMIMVVYLFAPIVCGIKRDIGEEKFIKVAWSFFVVSRICTWTSSHTFSWDIGSAVCYLGYFMLGYALKSKGSKDLSKAILYIMAAVIIEVVASKIMYLEKINYYPLGSTLWIQNVLLTIAAVLVFAGFSNLEIRRNWGELSALTFYIYLIHAFVWSRGEKWVRVNLGTEGDSRMVIPVATVIVFLLSIFLSILYKNVWEWFDNKYDFSKRFFRQN